MSSLRSGSCYASTAKLLNCLIACMLMSTIAFAAIPYFMVSHSKEQIAVKDYKPHTDRTHILAAKKNANPGILYSTKPSVYRASRTKGKAAFIKYEGNIKVQVVTSRPKRLSPATIEARTKKKDEKVQTQ